MTAKSRKRKLARVRAHAKRQDRRGGVSTKPIRTARLSVVFPGPPPEPSLKDTFTSTAVQATHHEVLQNAAKRMDEIPKRAKCPSCQFSQKVTKAGLMGRHDVYVGDRATQCEGSGMAFDAVVL